MGLIPLQKIWRFFSFGYLYIIWWKLSPFGTGWLYRRAIPDRTDGGAGSSPVAGSNPIEVTWAHPEGRRPAWLLDSRCDVSPSIAYLRAGSLNPTSLEVSLWHILEVEIYFPLVCSSPAHSRPPPDWGFRLTRTTHAAWAQAASQDARAWEAINQFNSAAA